MINPYTNEELMLAERIMDGAPEPRVAAAWIAEYREQLEEDMQRSLNIVYEALQTVRQREHQLLTELNLLNARIFEKADTIPAPKMQNGEQLEMEFEHV